MSSTPRYNVKDIKNHIIPAEQGKFSVYVVSDECLEEYKIIKANKVNMDGSLTERISWMNDLIIYDVIAWAIPLPSDGTLGVSGYEIEPLPISTQGVHHNQEFWRSAIMEGEYFSCLVNSITGRISASSDRQYKGIAEYFDFAIEEIHTHWVSFQKEQEARGAASEYAREEERKEKESNNA